MSTRTRLPRAVAVAASLLMTMGALVATPAATLAKTPNWSGTITALPGTVPSGGLAGYELTIKNNGPSNISALYLFTSGTAPDPAYVSDNRCNSTGPLQCSFGALRKGKMIDLIVAFPTSAGSSADFVVNFEWNTTGLGSGSGDNSHGDALSKEGRTHLNPNIRDNAGGFLIPGVSSTEIANDQNIDNDNPQSAKLFVPAGANAATIGDGEVGLCPTGFSCFGEATNLVVGDGSTQYGMFKIIVKLHNSELPNWINAGNASTVGVVHVIGDGSAVEDLPNCGAGTPTSPCKMVVAVPAGSASTPATFASSSYHHDEDEDCDDGYPSYTYSWYHHDDDECSTPKVDLEITIWLAQNGYIKYH